MTIIGASKTVALSVVVAAHNSADVIECTVARLAEHLSELAAEIIVVENASTDGTLALCRSMARGWPCGNVALTVLTSERGLGNAFRAGVAVSSGTRVLLTADDLPFGFDDLDADVALGQPRPPVLIGSKAHADSTIDRGILRAGMTVAFGALRRVVLDMRTGDPQGTFVVDGTLLRELAPRLREPGFLFTTELAYALELRGVQPLEVPVHLREEHSTHRTRISRADVISMALGLFRLRRRRAELAA